MSSPRKRRPLFPSQHNTTEVPAFAGMTPGSIAPPQSFRLHRPLAPSGRGSGVGGYSYLAAPHRRPPPTTASSPRKRGPPFSLQANRQQGFPLRGNDTAGDDSSPTPSAPAPPRPSGERAGVRGLAHRPISSLPRRCAPSLRRHRPARPGNPFRPNTTSSSAPPRHPRESGDLRFSSLNTHQQGFPL